jgi:hypothetical protein
MSRLPPIRPTGHAMTESEYLSTVMLGRVPLPKAKEQLDLF